MSAPKTIAFLTLGCKLNYAETSTYERGFKAAGLQVVPWSSKADAYLVNTCSVTATSDAKSRNLVRKVHRVNPDALIVVTGCSAELRRAELEKIDGVLRVFGCHEKHLVVPALLAELDGRHIPATGATPSTGDGCSAVFGAYSTGERTRSFLKVQDGCNNFCKYCTVPYARGESRNIPIAECVRMAGAIAAEGVKEIVLTGVNTGDFGRTTHESFLDLLKALNEVEGIERYRISSIEPNLITEEIIDWIASGTKFQPHFHIPLQTGVDSQLERMGRHYDTGFFADRIAYIRKALEGPGKPLVFFGIDVMVGLPGETREMFEQTKSFIESIRPAFIHVFPYSRRPGTPADLMPDQVSDEEKKERVAILERLCRSLSDEFRRANTGLHETVLFESTDRKGTMEGYTGNYIRVERPYDAGLVNQLVDVIL
ncbi:MAG: tRNA (N(6)-L-threonylcarbamoyladenosine(37)-C(2))-methylthiotransferase MtaB [Bacteroidales bacterium]|nr:tRNA (N(6)-L-threonylcarbamoyladenosine(37)-C(2))-methylthiotransferase MtaB [Bacteroidales bacterium]